MKCCIAYILLSFVPQILECMYSRQALDVLEGLIPVGDDAKTLNVNTLQKLIVFSIMWSLGALLELDDRKKVRERDNLNGDIEGD